MTTHWTTRLADGLAKVFNWQPPASYLADPAFRDADDRRMEHDLDAIRIRFPDHA